MIASLAYDVATFVAFQMIAAGLLVAAFFYILVSNRSGLVKAKISGGMTIAAVCSIFLGVWLSLPTQGTTDDFREDVDAAALQKYGAIPALPLVSRTSVTGLTPFSAVTVGGQRIAVTLELANGELVLLDQTGAELPTHQENTDG